MYEHQIKVMYSNHLIERPTCIHPCLILTLTVFQIVLQFFYLPFQWCHIGAESYSHLPFLVQHTSSTWLNVQIHIAQLLLTKQSSPLPPLQIDPVWTKLSQRLKFTVPYSSAETITPCLSISMRSTVRMPQSPLELKAANLAIPSSSAKEIL